MMRVTVEYTAQLKRAAGISRDEFELNDGALLPELVAEIANRHGDELARMLQSADGSPQATVLPFVADQQVRWDAPDALQDGVTVTLLSPISGG